MLRPDRLRRLDHALGRLAFRAVGLAVGAFAVGVGWMAWHALRADDLGATVLMGAVALGAAVLARHCFSPDRRLTELGD